MDNFMEVIEQLAKKIHLSSNCFKSSVWKERDQI